MKKNSIINLFKSYKKVIIWFLIISLVATGVGLLFVNWTNLKIIYAAGSSAVAPLLEELNYAYQSTTKNNIDMNVSPTGSGNGIESIVTSTKNLGNVSRSPSIEETGLPEYNNNPSVSGTYSLEWEQKKLKTITWGWDTICIIYKPKTSDFILDVNANNIEQIYNCIAGLGTYTLNDFKSSKSPSNDTTTITPFARTGGANKSGTTEAFIKSSHLIDWNILKKQESIKVLENGNYTTRVKTTKESNIESWKTISADGGYGAMTYLSGGFVLSNLSEIYNSGFRVATYNNITLEKANITNGYDWFRPLNSIVSLDAPDYVKDWVYWVISGEYNADKTVNGVFDNINIIPLNQKQINSMCLDNQFNTNNFWLSDYQLYLKAKPLPFGASE